MNDTRLPEPKDGMSPFEYAVSLVSGKWKLPILFEIGIRHRIHYGELRRAIRGISDKVLADQLRQMEDCGLIIRRSYLDCGLTRVEYALSYVGMDFMPVIMEICRWGKRCGWENMTEEHGWKDTVTVWGPLGEGDDVHWPTDICRRIHTPPASCNPDREGV